MKTIIRLLVFSLIIIFKCFCSDSILSKFHQHSFKIKDFRAELIDYNDKYYRTLEIKTFKYNRTTAALNVTQVLKISVQDNLEVVVQGHKFLSNEYRHFPIRFQYKLKQMFDAGVGGLRNVKNCGNITNMFFEKDVIYHVCNFVCDATHLPPLIPNGRFRFDANVTYLNEYLALIYIFAEIYVPFPYPRN